MEEMEYCNLNECLRLSICTIELALFQISFRLFFGLENLFLFLQAYCHNLSVFLRLKKCLCHFHVTLKKSISVRSVFLSKIG